MVCRIPASPRDIAKPSAFLAREGPYVQTHLFTHVRPNPCVKGSRSSEQLTAAIYVENGYKTELLQEQHPEQRRSFLFAPRHSPQHVPVRTDQGPPPRSAFLSSCLNPRGAMSTALPGAISLHASGLQRLSLTSGYPLNADPSCQNDGMSSTCGYQCFANAGAEDAWIRHQSNTSPCCLPASFCCRDVWKAGGF